MFDIGFAELLVVLVLGLVILGPERLPKAVYKVGKWLGAAKGAMGNFQHQVERELRAKELAEKMQDPQYRFDQEEQAGSWESKLDPQPFDVEPSATKPSKSTTAKAASPAYDKSNSHSNSN